MMVKNLKPTKFNQDWNCGQLRMCLGCMELLLHGIGNMVACGLHGSMVALTWLHGSMAAWKYCMVVPCMESCCTCGSFVEAWLYGCMEAWLLGCMGYGCRHAGKKLRYESYILTPLFSMRKCGKLRNFSFSQEIFHFPWENWNPGCTTTVVVGNSNLPPAPLPPRK